MQTYPESSKAMDLVAEHRLRSLHRSQAWQARQRQSDDSPHLGGIIQQILQVPCPISISSVGEKGQGGGGSSKDSGCWKVLSMQGVPEFVSITIWSPGVQTLNRSFRQAVTPCEIALKA